MFIKYNYLPVINPALLNAWLRSLAKFAVQRTFLILWNFKDDLNLENLSRFLYDRETKEVQRDS